jgi:hypothetical protein
MTRPPFRALSIGVSRIWTWALLVTLVTLMMHVSNAQVVIFYNAELTSNILPYNQFMVIGHFIICPTENRSLPAVSDHGN